MRATVRAITAKAMIPCFWVLAMGLCLGMSGSALAQTDSGRISGIVEDESQAAIPGAAVTVVNTRTAEQRTVMTKDDGSFVVAPLRPSNYTIRVSKDQFAPVEVNNVEVTVGADAHRTYTLRVASAATSVTVTSGAETPMDTTSARIGVNVTEREVSQLPINGRQLSQLFLQAPGAVNGASGTYQDIRFSGRSVEQNAIRYDGVEASAIIDAAPGNMNGEIAAPAPFRLQASVENIQEFRVESNNYPAEYGTGTGGQVSVVTKSGSNAFHGSLYEYLRNDKLDARNLFDVPGIKSKLRLNQFGTSFGGPLVKDKLFFFAYYEGYRFRGGSNSVESAPSSRIKALPACASGVTFTSSGKTCVSAAVQPFLAGFVSPNAVLIVPDANTTVVGNANLDGYLLPGLGVVDENSGGLRLDYHLNANHNFYVRYFRDQGTNSYPEGISGRNVVTSAVPQNAAASLTSMFGGNVVNEFTVGFNGAKSRINSSAPTINGIDYSAIALNTSGSIALPSIAGQGGSAGLSVPGGLIRANSATNGRGAPYTPSTYSFIDSLSWVTGNHSLKVGGEIRAVRLYTDRLGGTTYSFSNLTDFLDGKLSSVDEIADLSLPSPFNNGATGQRYLKQNYYIAYAQDEIKLRPNLTLNVGLRYEYYSALHEDRNLYILMNLDNGTLFNSNFCQTPASGTPCTPKDQPWYKASPGNFGPRVSVAWSPRSSQSGLFGRDHTVIRAGFGILYGPGQTEDLLQPAESDRIWTTPSGGTFCGLASSCNKSAAALDAAFLANPNDRSARIRAYTNDYTVPERIYQYSASWQQQWGGFVSTVAYVGSQGRNLFLRNVGNRIVAVRTSTAASGGSIAVRQFDIDCNGVAPVAGTPTATCPAIPNANTVLHPYAESDFKTSGGYDSYNALQMSLLRRFSALTLSAQYSFAKSFGTSAGSNDAVTTQNFYDYNNDKGYNLFDVRHSFNVSALYRLPLGRGHALLSNAGSIAEAVLGNWEIGTIVSARSGVPVPVQITRPDVVFRGLSNATFNGNSMAGQIFGSAVTAATAGTVCPGTANIAAGVCTEAIINVPGGGNTRNVRRPDVVPGVPQFLANGYLNPAAFAIPQPGTYGNLQRGSVHGPSFAQADFTAGKKFPVRESMNFEFRAEIFNILNHPNFANPPAQLGNVLPSAPAAVMAQPGMAYNSTAGSPLSAGAFGKFTSTVSQQIGSGTNRQIQFAIRLNF